MNCVGSRESKTYRDAVAFLVQHDMVFPADDHEWSALERQSFELFSYVFEKVYCLDACRESRETYQEAIDLLGDHEAALLYMFNDGWRVMFWYNQRIRIVQLDSL